MRILIQRVKEASVSINGLLKSQINNGLLVFLGIEHEDGPEDLNWLVDKLIKLRIFDDERGVMNLSITDVSGQLLIISQFTLHANTRKGARPSYIRAARPEQAIPLYEEFINRIKEKTGVKPESGEFGADMQVALINDGPVSIWIDSKNRE
jgi:D-tyrosyl-tRNA(Tyr) deacylase